MRTSKWFNLLKTELESREFFYSPAPGVSSIFKHRDGFEVGLYRDGSFHVAYPDCHGGSCAAKSTKDLLGSLRFALDGYWERGIAPAR